MRRIIAVLGGLLLCAGARGQSPPPSATTETQFLPEVDTFFKLTETGRIFLQTQGTAGPSDSENAAVALAWDQRFGDRVSFRGGYYFQYNTAEPVSRDQRIQLAVNLRFPVAWRVIATDRNLVEARWIDGNPSQRYRNRLTLEKEFIGLLGKAHTLDLEAEVFYDTRSHAWHHQEYTAGIETLISQRLSIELYYQRQESQGGSQPAHVNAAGLTIQIFVDARSRGAPPVVIAPAR